MITLKDLREELIGVRMYAQNTSLWYLAGSLDEAARLAINEGLRTYEFTVQRRYNSINLPDTGQAIAILPADVDRIVECHAVAGTGGGPRRRLKGYEHRATAETNFLYLNAKSYPGARNVEVLYESRIKDAPRDLVLASALAIGGGSVTVSGGVPAAEWRFPGYFALTPGGTSRGTTHREVIRYDAVTPTAFTGLSRNVGQKSALGAWSIGDILTCVLELPEQARTVIQHAAQAEMYHFWVKNRALYDQYTAIASFQQLDLGDLLGIVRSEEDRADRRYKKASSPPEPTHANIKRRRR